MYVSKQCGNLNNEKVVQLASNPWDFLLYLSIRSSPDHLVEGKFNSRQVKAELVVPIEGTKINSQAIPNPRAKGKCIEDCKSKTST